MKYKIVADSASNVLEMNDTAYACVPLRILCGGQEYVDTPELDLPGMISDLKTTRHRSSTSCPNVHDWLQAFEGADAIFAVCISSALSGSFSAAQQAKELYLEAHPDAQVHVIDSLSAGSEMHLILEKLSSLIEKEFSFAYIVQAIQSYCKHTHVIFCLQSLTNLARNGRVNPAAAKLASLLGIRLVGRGSEKGTLEPFAKCRGEARGLDTIFREMLSRGFKGGRVLISHCFNIEAATNLKQMIQKKFAACRVSIESCTALCSYYAELGGLIVGYEAL